MFLTRIIRLFTRKNNPAPVVVSRALDNNAPVKRKKDRIPKKVRDDVWYKYHRDETYGECYCCGKFIHRYKAGWHCSHVVADVKSGPEIVENLRTCCPHCNLSMGDKNLYAYIRDKKLNGPGAKNVKAYFKQHPSQIFDTRTNNWTKNKK